MNIEKIIYIICIFILLLLDLAIPIYSKTFSCDKCTVIYRSKRVTMEKSYFQEYKLLLQDIYNEYIKDECLIKWDKIEGYKIYNVSKLK